jgi:AcrR family transcriptional regulator
VAAGLMTRHGVAAVQMAEVAATGGVSRQLVYRFFASRPALLRAVLEDFADALTREFDRRAMDRLPVDVEEATRVYVDAVCDTIESKGAGPWICSTRRVRTARSRAQARRSCSA